MQSNKLIRVDPGASFWCELLGSAIDALRINSTQPPVLGRLPAPSVPGVSPWLALGVPYHPVIILDLRYVQPGPPLVNNAFVLWPECLWTLAGFLLSVLFNLRFFKLVHKVRRAVLTLPPQTPAPPTVTMAAATPAPFPVCHDGIPPGSPVNAIHHKS